MNNNDDFYRSELESSCCLCLKLCALSMIPLDGEGQEMRERKSWRRWPEQTNEEFESSAAGSLCVARAGVALSGPI